MTTTTERSASTLQIEQAEQAEQAEQTCLTAAALRSTMEQAAQARQAYDIRTHKLSGLIGQLGQLGHPALRAKTDGVRRGINQVARQLDNMDTASDSAWQTMRYVAYNLVDLQSSVDTLASGTNSIRFDAKHFHYQLQTDAKCIRSLTERRRETRSVSRPPIGQLQPPSRVFGCSAPQLCHLAMGISTWAFGPAVVSSPNFRLALS